MNPRRKAYAVWEITLACNLSCLHCGSRAGAARPNELNTQEALDLVQQLAEVGITEVSLIGGEAFLRPDWLVIARAITDAGMLCSLATGGYGISRASADKMLEAGILVVSVSVDGLPATHDHLRGRPGSYEQALVSMQHLAAAGIGVGCNTQINRLSAPELPQLYQALRQNGMRGWQLQMTVPMGNAADRPELLLQPEDLLILHPVLARLAKRAFEDGISFEPGNNVGYFGPFETILRGGGAASSEVVWQGCQAGLACLGIEADGTIKGCPSLPTQSYTGGNIRVTGLRQVVSQAPELTFNLEPPDLWGYCRECPFSKLCRGGCNWTAHSWLGRRGNNPLCYHRALVMRQRGLRERLIPSQSAPGTPFDHGIFELESQSADLPGDPLALTEASIVWPADWPAVDLPSLDDYCQRL